MWQIPCLGGACTKWFSTKGSPTSCVTLRNQLGRSGPPSWLSLDWYPGTACVPGRQDVWGNSWARNPPVESHSFIFQPHRPSKICPFPTTKRLTILQIESLPIFVNINKEVEGSSKVTIIFETNQWSEKPEKISSLVGTVIWEIWLQPLVLAMPCENPVHWADPSSNGDLAHPETLVEEYAGSTSSSEKYEKFSFEGGTVKVVVVACEDPVQWAGPVLLLGIWLNRSGWEMWNTWNMLKPPRLPCLQAINTHEK